MNIDQMHAAVKLGLDKTEGLAYAAFEVEEIDFWLNEAIDRFIKTRYSGMNVKRESFEQSQKRTDDLRSLVKESRIPPTVNPPIREGVVYVVAGNTVTYDSVVYAIGATFTGVRGVTAISAGAGTYTDVTAKPNSYLIDISDFPVDYLLFLNDEASITFNHEVTGVSTSLRTYPVVCTSDTYSSRVNDPYSEHRLHLSTARPLRLFSDKGVELITDGQYTISNYYLKYLRKPTRVNYALTGSQTTATSNIVDGIQYLVSANTVTYNGVVYGVGEVFTGVLGVTTFTGAGTATAQIAHCDLPEHTHREIVLLTVRILIENIESPRYQTESVEINQSE